MFPKVHVAKVCCLRNPIKIESPRKSWRSWEVAFACENRNDTFMLDGRRRGDTPQLFPTLPQVLVSSCK